MLNDKVVRGRTLLAAVLLVLAGSFAAAAQSAPVVAAAPAAAAQSAPVVAAAPAAAPATPACDPVAGLEGLVRSGQVLLLGEMHGTVESPAFVDRAVCLALAMGRQVTVGLEIPLEEDGRIRAFLASPGGAADRAAMLAGAFWQAPFQDGRRSQAMVALLDALRARMRAGQPVRLVLIDSVAFAGGSARDRAMAMRLRDALSAASRDLLVVLTGNIHTRVRRGLPWDAAYEPMGLVLTQVAPAARVVGLDVAYAGGTAWICGTDDPASCGARTVKGRAAPAGVTLYTAPDAAGYGGFYGVGTITASPPAALPARTPAAASAAQASPTPAPPATPAMQGPPAPPATTQFHRP